MDVRLAITGYKCADGKYGATLVFTSFSGQPAKFRHMDLPCFVALDAISAKTHVLSEVSKVIKDRYDKNINEIEISFRGSW